MFCWHSNYLSFRAGKCSHHVVSPGLHNTGLFCDNTKNRWTQYGIMMSWLCGAPYPHVFTPLPVFINILCIHLFKYNIIINIFRVYCSKFKVINYSSVWVTHPFRHTILQNCFNSATLESFGAWTPCLRSLHRISIDFKSRLHHWLPRFLHWGLWLSPWFVGVPKP